MLTTSNLTMQFGAAPLFENVSVKFSDGHRYGLIGANGCGKSTFMKILGGDLEPSSGSVSKDPGERIGKLKQDQFAYESTPVIDTVIMGHEELWVVKQERDRIYGLPEMSEEDELVVAKFGTHLGTAFQLVDDILDYSADSDEMGKNVGDDLAEGKPTLPLIHALAQSKKNGAIEDANLIKKAIEEGGLDLIEEITGIIRKNKSLEYTIEVAKKETQLANDCLKALPDSEFKTALNGLANYSLSRTT